MLYKIYIRHEDILPCGCVENTCAKTVIIAAKDLDKANEMALKKNPECNTAFWHETLH